MIKRLVFLAVLTLSSLAFAQDNYEIEVYPSEIAAPHTTLLELHSNFTVDGSKAAAGSRFADDGTAPTNHAIHETLEVTQGFTNWFETGFYLFTSDNPGFGYRVVGSHIRPRFRAPEEWHLPVGLGLSTEFGYQRPLYSKDTWSFELRPIVDKKIGRTYMSFNPTFERALKGPGTEGGFEFSPNVKVAYDVLRWHHGDREKTISAGLEYYGALGPVTGLDPVREQQHQFFPNVDIDVSEKWEFNFGVGIGATTGTDHLIVKAIVGRRFSWGRGESKANHEKE